jgi:hypothetical protein
MGAGVSDHAWEMEDIRGIILLLIVILLWAFGLLRVGTAVVQ